MPRGGSRQPSPIGSTRIAQNGYHYTKVAEGWRLTHHIVAEEKLGRPLEKNERVYFKDNNRANLTPVNIAISDRKVDRQKRREQLQNKIAILQAALAELEEG